MKQLIFGLMVLFMMSCTHDGYVASADKDPEATNVLFLHHSTGRLVFQGAESDGKPDVQAWFNHFNDQNGRKINFVEQVFPKSKQYRFFGYGWNNYPYDYYNIWVKNQDKKSYKGEPSLDLLVLNWDVIVIKHCFPVSSVGAGSEGDIDSPEKTVENYKLQYEALKAKMKQYPYTKFVVWTGAALTEASSNIETARNAKLFFDWVKSSWDEPGDNIHIWDFFALETDDGIFMNDEYASSAKDAHPNKKFARTVAPLLCQRIVDIIDNGGTGTDLKGRTIFGEIED